MIGILSGVAVLAVALQVGQQVPAPVLAPVQLTTAKTLFMGMDSCFDKTRCYTAYQELYGALTAHHFQLVDTPAQAELSLELSLYILVTDVSRGSSSNSTILQLKVRDTKTGALIWTFSEQVEGAFRETTFNKNLSAAVAEILTDWDALTPDHNLSTTGHNSSAAGHVAKPQSTGKTRFSQRDQNKE